MVDAAKAPLSEFSPPFAQARARFDAALSELRAGGDPARTLDALEHDARELFGQDADTELGRAYAEVLRDAETTLPFAAHRELSQRAMRRATQERAAELTTQASEQALKISPPTERAPTRKDTRPTAPELEASSASPNDTGGDDELLATITRGGDAGAAALVELGERWLLRGQAREGLARLPQNVAAFGSDAALDVLERLYERADERERLEQLLVRRVAAQSGALGRARALERLGEHRLGLGETHGQQDLLACAQVYREADEPEEAERVYERLLQLAPEQREAAERLVELRAASGSFANIAPAFAVLLASEPDNRRLVDGLLALEPHAARASAAVEYAELADDVLWRLSNDERELSERVLRSSAVLLAQQGHPDEAAELYRRLIADRPTSEILDEFQALIEASSSAEWRSNQQRWLFEWREHHVSDRPTVLLNWARFEQHDLGDPEAARAVLERAAALAPDRGEIWEELLRLRLSDGDGDGSVAAARELLRLGHEVEAALLPALLEYDPGARWAVDRVKLVLSAEARWPELFELYDRAEQATSDAGERAAWLDEAAVAARDVAQDRQRAIDYWQRYLELMPDDRRVPLALERLYEQTGNQRGLLSHLEQRAAGASEAERGSLERRIAELSLELGALSQALVAVEGRVAAGDAAAAALLERLFEASSARQSEDATVRTTAKRASELLRAHYVRQREPEKTLALLRRELTFTTANKERRELLCELSRIHEHELSDLAGAFEVERELFLATRAERDRKRLEKLAKKLGAWGDLCETYARAASEGDDLRARRLLLERAADLALLELADERLARRYYRSWLELEAERATELLAELSAERGNTPAAFEALCDLLSDQKRFVELSSVLARAAESAPTPALLSRLGRLYADDLGDVASAISWHLAAGDARAAGEVFLRAASVFADDVERAIELGRRLVSVGLAEGAVRVLRHQLDFFAERYPAARKLVQLELVKVLRELGQPDAASEELNETARRFPADADVQRACADAAIARHDWDKAEQCYRTLLLLLHRPQPSSSQLRKSSIYVELGAIKQARGDDAAAAELFDSGFEAALADVDELAALLSGFVAHACWEQAERGAAELLRLAQSPESAAAALSGIAKLAEQRKASSALLQAANDLAERQLADLGPENAADAGIRSKLLTAAVSLLPLEKARQIWQDRARELSASDLPRARAELSRRLLEAGGAHERTLAIAELSALVSHPDAPSSAWSSLLRAFEGHDAEQLAATLARWLEREPRNPEALERALARALDSSDAEQAIELHGRLTAVLPVVSSELVLSVAKLALGQGKREVALAKLLEHAGGKPRRREKALAQVLRLAAELLLEDDALAEALPLLSEAHQLDKTDLDTSLLLGLLALDLDRLEIAGPALRALATSRERVSTGSDRARARRLAQGYFQLARLEQSQGKLGTAKRWATRALEHNPALSAAERLLGELSH